jgi:hypothetical protein
MRAGPCRFVEDDKRLRDDLTTLGLDSALPTHTPSTSSVELQAFVRPSCCEPVEFTGSALLRPAEMG